MPACDSCTMCKTKFKRNGIGKNKTHNKIITENSDKGFNCVNIVHTK